MTKLDEAMGGWAGRLLNRGLDLLFAGRNNCGIGEPTLEEFRVMQVLESERMKYERDRMEQAERDREREH